ncbi:MAG: Hachiman antiphage defense system protein HamA, partial [Bacteroidota bacterium]
LYAAKDRKTKKAVPHRALSEKKGKRKAAVTSIREMLVRHHASPEMLAQSAHTGGAMKRLGFESQQARLSRFPRNPTTQKGNLAEILLAEYIVAACGAALPVYRLWSNTNPDQSMKGEDVLAFDLDSTPIRIIIGESKFRSTSSATAVIQIVDDLTRSYKGGLPASLQFVADRLFERGETDLGLRVSQCAVVFARGTLRLDYVGMLLSDKLSEKRVHEATSNSLRRLAMLSLGIANPDSLVEACFAKLP